MLSQLAHPKVTEFSIFPTVARKSPDFLEKDGLLREPIFFALLKSFGP
jgi:hypothetical protein